MPTMKNDDGELAKELSVVVMEALARGYGLGVFS